MMERFYYPFTALVGMEQAKQALLIALVNPRAGGLLLSGPKGTAKSTLVRSAAVLTKTGQLAELPLGATEDMVFGSIDLEAALATGTKQLRSGVLFRAAETILYMDEVNLLRSDFLTAVLDSAANGFFELQRDGICYREDVSYTPVGTMNPEEGTLSSAMLDRFGLFVSLEDEMDANARVEVVKRVLDFERTGEEFWAVYAEQERELAEKIANARACLPSVEASEAILELVAQYCARAYCRGNRADLYLLEAARAIAALAARSYIMPQDVEQAAMFVLPHRMGQPPQQQAPAADDSETDTGQDENSDDSSDESPDAPEENAPGQSEDDSQPEKDADDEPENDADEDAEESAAPPLEGENQDSGDDQTEDAAGDMEQVFAALENMPVPPMSIENHFEHQKREGSGKRSLTRTDSRLGRYVRAELPRGHRGLDLAFDATLRAAAPYQRSRSGKQAVIICPEDYRSRVREKHIGANIIFLVDASGSMGAQARMKTVKGVILSLLKEAYQKRDRVGLIAFRRDKAEVLLPVTRSVDLAEKLLRDLPTGGKTPLAEGLESTLQMLYGLDRRDKGQQTVVVLITDGRANATYDQDDPVVRALQAAEKFSRTPALSVVLDTETDFLKLGIAPQIARKMGASYYTLRRLSAERVLRIVKSMQA
jgi:magnesium chelatase subunit D